MNWMTFIGGLDFKNYSKPCEQIRKNFDLYFLGMIYSEYSGKTPIVGIFTHRTPELMVLDAKLVEEILVSKFKKFHANATNVGIPLSKANKCVRCFL